MLSIKYRAGAVHVSTGGTTFVIDRLGTLDRVIAAVRKRRAGKCSRRRFNYYQGVLDLLCHARNDFLRNVDAQIYAG